MVLIIFLLLTAFLAVDFAIDKRLFSPVKIFNGIWLLTFTLYFLNLSYIQSDFSDRTLLVFLLCIFTFNITYYIGWYIISRKKKDKNLFEAISIGQGSKIEKEPKENRKVDFKKKMKAINVGFIILFIVEIMYSKYIPLVSMLLGKGSNYTTFGIPSLNGLLYSVAICMGAYYIYKKNPRCLIYVGFGLLVVSRQLLISMLIEFAVLFACKKMLDKKITWKGVIKAAAAVVIVFAGFVVVGNLRSGSDEMKNVFEPRSEYENLPNAAMWVYSYLEFSFSNFNKLTYLTNGGVNHGSSTINTILPSVISKSLKLQNNFNEPYLIKLNFNVSTWFPEVYIDFGLFGIVIFSLLVSILGVFLYRRVLVTGLVKDSLLYAVFAHNILLFFFINFFLYLPVVAQFLVIPLIFSGMGEKDE